MTNNDLLDQAVLLLNSILDERHAPSGLPEQLAGHQEFALIVDKVCHIRESILAIASGDLAAKTTSKGFVSGAIKTLQAHLSHLTWQTKMIADGDYSQRVDFMGEFSKAFNSMVLELDVTVKALQDSQERYRNLAHTDSLTGLYNRRHFQQLAEREVSRSLRHKHPLSLAMVDIDHFKLVNDDYGHDVGDRVLQMVAVVMEESLRTIDVVARFGGEEFIVLLPETEPVSALLVAERLRASLAAHEILVGRDLISVTASLGVSRLEGVEGRGGDLGGILEMMIKAADEALYAAKEGGRDQVMAAWS